MPDMSVSSKEPLVKGPRRHQEPSSEDEKGESIRDALQSDPEGNEPVMCPADTAKELAMEEEEEEEEETGSGNGVSPGVQTKASGILCGPLLHYKGMSNAGSEASFWHGSVLIVSNSGATLPKLKLQYQGSWKGDSKDTVVQLEKAVSHFAYDCMISGVTLYTDTAKAFWRFTIDLPLQNHEACWVYSIADRGPSNSVSNAIAPHSFVVPSVSQSMRIMFYSCNGFSVGTDEDAWSSPALWNDVLRSHAQKPFHVMIGGGDQIYNDSVRVDGPLKAWTEIKNPKIRRGHLFDEVLRTACDSYYFENYLDRYAKGQFARANSQIPQINIWNDHGKL